MKNSLIKTIIFYERIQEVFRKCVPRYIEEDVYKRCIPGKIGGDDVKSAHG